jgi:hypothetical protein
MAVLNHGGAQTMASTPQGRSILLDRGDIRRLLHEIGTELAANGRTAEIAIYGGAALILTFDHRDPTRDVDYVWVSGDTDAVAEAADKVGAAHGMEPGWFNDAVSMFVSDHPETEFLGDFPAGNGGGLRVFLASPRYVLAMKMMAMRSSLETNDFADIWMLVEACGVRDMEGAEACLRGYFGPDGLPQRSKELLAELLADRAAGKDYDPMRYW